MSSPVRAGSLATYVLSLLLTLALAAALLVFTNDRGASSRGTKASARSAAGSAAPAAPRTRIPGNFRGYGFDQCLAPTQWKMNQWLKHSPFLAVGIYISGDSRACRDQPNLTPTWIRKQRRKGWRLLPITLGPQASCQPRFPRYHDDVKIKPWPGKDGKYRKARRMGRAEAAKTVTEARRLGLPRNSVLWYDLEGFNYHDTRCRESALAFLSAWTWRLHDLNYKSGVYSSAGSGIKMLDEARVKRRGKFNLPDMVWVARWDGKANTSVSTSYLRKDGWRPGARVKQYQGGHDEKHGGVTINIDRNFLDVGRGIWTPYVKRCDGVRIGFPDYKWVYHGERNGNRAHRGLVRALKCLLKEKGLYDGPLGGQYTWKLNRAVNAWQKRTGLPEWNGFGRRNWMTLFAHGNKRVVKYGSAGPAVRRVKRALNASSPRISLKADGRFTARTHSVVRGWQKRIGIRNHGVVNPGTWSKLAEGRRG